MRIHADFSQPVLVTPDSHHWVASPQAGVERVMLERIGHEVARATSLVRYAPDSVFPAHTHERGEEILVLSGQFSEGERHYPAGWYLRNPPGSRHQPASASGALLFVKLRQMAPDERQAVRIDTTQRSRWQRLADRDLCPLFSAPAEQVSLQRFDAGRPLHWPEPGGAELLVLQGALRLDGRPCPQGSWLRLPAGHRAGLQAGPAGATVYLKTGHLAEAALAATQEEGL